MSNGDIDAKKTMTKGYKGETKKQDNNIFLRQRS